MSRVSGSCYQTVQSPMDARSFETVSFRRVHLEKWAAQDALLGKLRHDDFSIQSCAMTRTALLRRREQIDKAEKALLRKIWNDDKYDMSWWRTCVDIDWLKASGVRGS